ncbi:hypothetical protein P3T76_013751 [Phytophthora citrophthora]|uniref:Uncharacterized protein n=1 Tax=Phytophthora citrophthora TaxID=4793 RepID=A0AAD9G2D3_9STRA|nr:hypothetical protein P3T76_013751 [Phytophthora citrophthora]
MKLFLAKKGGAWVRLDDSDVINPHSVASSAKKLPSENIADLYGDVLAMTPEPVIVECELIDLVLQNAFTDMSSLSSSGAFEAN